MKLGEIKRGKEIGHVRTHNKFIWVRCPSCRKERWVDLCQYNASVDKENMRCKVCNGRVQGKRNKDKFSWW
jgi:transcription elongation factor Elf1